MVLKAIAPDVRCVTYPRVIEGDRWGPPEDVGGPCGYTELLEAIAVAAAAEVPTKTEQTLSSAPSAAKEDSQLTGSANEDPDPRIVASDSEPRPQVESDDANNVTAPADAADAENDEKSKVVVQATMKGGSRQSGGLALVRFGMGKVRGRADDKMTLATEGNPNLKYQRVGRQEMQSRT